MNPAQKLSAASFITRLMANPERLRDVHGDIQHVPMRHEDNSVENGTCITLHITGEMHKELVKLIPDGVKF